MPTLAEIKIRLGLIFKYRLFVAPIILSALLLAYREYYTDPFWQNLLPEFIGATVTWLLVELFWSARAYEQFRGEMLGIRRQLRARVDRQEISPDQAQDTVAD